MASADGTTTYGVQLTEEQVAEEAELRKQWREGVQSFLAGEVVEPEEVVELEVPEDPEDEPAVPNRPVLSGKN